MDCCSPSPVFPWSANALTDQGKTGHNPPLQWWVVSRNKRIARIVIFECLNKTIQQKITNVSSLTIWPSKSTSKDHYQNYSIQFCKYNFSIWFCDTAGLESPSVESYHAGMLEDNLQSSRWKLGWPPPQPLAAENSCTRNRSAACHHVTQRPLL